MYVLLNNIKVSFHWRYIYKDVHTVFHLVCGGGVRDPQIKISAII